MESGCLRKWSMHVEFLAVVESPRVLFSAQDTHRAFLDRPKTSALGSRFHSISRDAPECQRL